MKKMFFVLLMTISFVTLTNAQSPESIARKFCEAVYNNDMATAKSYMMVEDAQRTPDRMSFTREEGLDYQAKLRNSKAKIIEGMSSSFVTVRFYNPNIEYLSKNNRWFCCAVMLVKVNSSTWKVTDYGY